MEAHAVTDEITNHDSPDPLASLSSLRFRSGARQWPFDTDREIVDLLALLDDMWTPPALRLRIHIACGRLAAHRFNRRSPAAG